MLQAVEHCPRHWQRPSQGRESLTVAPLMSPGGRTQSPLSPGGSPLRLCCMKGVCCRYDSSQELCRSTHYHRYFPDPTRQCGCWPGPVCCLPAWAWAELAWEPAEWKHSPTGSNQAICNLHKQGGQGIILLPVLLAIELLIQTKLPFI